MTPLGRLVFTLVALVAFLGLTAIAYRVADRDRHDGEHREPAEREHDGEQERRRAGQIHRPEGTK